jgi:hypothetical protein
VIVLTATGAASSRKITKRLRAAKAAMTIGDTYRLAGPLSLAGGRRRRLKIFALPGVAGAARPLGSGRLTFEQNENKKKTLDKREWEMADLVQDVVSLLSMSAFIVSAAMWIGAM